MTFYVVILMVPVLETLRVNGCHHDNFEHVNMKTEGGAVRLVSQECILVIARKSSETVTHPLSD